jgi:hypothetical protein
MRGGVEEQVCGVRQCDGISGDSVTWDTLSIGGVKTDPRRAEALARILRINESRPWRRAALGGILLLAAGLLFYKLDALGYANHYYTAGVASMLQSWHNFFFVVAEPGGSVSIDKPPLGLWLQAVSAYFLGVNGFAMVLPEIICGLLAIIVLYHLVRRAFGGNGNSTDNGQNGGFGGQMQVSLYDCAAG